MVAHGDAAKRMWFTELGFSSCAPGSNPWCITEDVAGALRGRRAAYRARPLGLRGVGERLQPAQQGHEPDRPGDPDGPGAPRLHAQAGLLGVPRRAGRAARASAARPEPPAPSRPAPSGAPLAAPTPAPAPLDATPPVLGSLSARLGPRRRTAVVAFRSSEPAVVRLRLERSVRRARMQDCLPALGGRRAAAQARRRRRMDPPSPARARGAAGALPPGGVRDRSRREPHAAQAARRPSTALACRRGTRRPLTTISHRPRARAGLTSRYRKAPPGRTVIRAR